MTHLAACGECRDVVVLIAPAEAPPLAAAAVSRQWFTIAVLRWAAIPATIAVIVGAVLLHNGMHPRQPSNAPPSVEVAQSQAPATRPQPPAEPPAAASAQETSQVAKSPESRKTPIPSRGEGRDRLTASTAAREKEETVAVTAAVPRVTPPQSSTQNIVVAEAKPAAAPPPHALNTPGTAANSRSDMALVAPAPPPPAPPAVDQAEVTGNAGRSLRKSTPAATPGAMAAAPAQGAVGGAVPPTRYVVADRLGSQLRISPTGKLERRADASGPWRPAAIDGTFRALARVGRDVWAGGNAGVLYYSPDDGVTWQRVGVPITDDIVSLAFSDARNGALTTARRQQYVTHDAGATWQKTE